MFDDEMDPIDAGRKPKDERTPYKPVKNPSPEEFLLAGYETLAIGDPQSAYFNTAQDRDLISRDPTMDRRLIRRPL